MPLKIRLIVIITRNFNSSVLILREERRIMNENIKKIDRELLRYTSWYLKLYNRYY